MNMNEDEKWHSLLARSVPAFVGETEPPYGFTTAILARLAERESKQMEKIGLRAFFAALAVLAITTAVTLDLHFQSRGELEPGVRSLIQMENVPVS